MKKLFIIAVLMVLVAFSAYTQGVGVNNDGAMPVAGTMLDVKGATDNNTTYGMQVKNSSGTAIMVVRSEGNVGIGTATPGSRLEISNTADNNNFIYSTTGANGRFALGTDASANVLFRTFNNVDLRMGVGTADDITIKNGGNVGIGTTSPSYGLHLHNGATASGMLNISGTGSGYTHAATLLTSTDDYRGSGHYMEITESGQEGTWYLGTPYSGTGNFQIGYFANDYAGGGNAASDDANAVITVAESGNVGIGTTTPTAALEVNGRTVKFSNDHMAYTWRFGGSTDLDWKNIATVALGTGTYKAVAFEVKITNAGTNFGHSASGQVYIYNVSMRRSGAVQDDYDDAIVVGPSTEYVRAVKTSTGNYELQVRQATNWRHMKAEAKVTSHNNGVTITYADSPTNGSTGGTIYTATAGLSGSANYILNQNSTGQSADYRITGVGRADGGFQVDGTQVIGANGSDVYGDIRVIRNTHSSDGMYIGYNNAGGTSGHVRFYANGTNLRMMLNASSGNVGIGNVSSPSRQLHVLGPTATYPARLQSSAGYLDIGPANASFCHFQTDRPTFYMNTALQVNSGNIGSYDENLSLRTASTTRVTVLNSNGNVGIGTTGPTETLDVNGYVALQGKQALRGNDSWLRLNQANAFTSGTYSPYLIRSDGGFQVDGLQVIDANAGWHRSYGNTGWYNGTHGGGIYMVDATWIRTYGNKSFYHNTGVMRTDGTFQVGGGGARFLVQTGGNVGIGDTTPSQKLEVNGRVKSNGINETSDVRLKKNVSAIPNALSSVQQVQGVFYNWKSPEELEKENIDATLSPNTERIEMGFIAQDLEKIIPELVDTDDEGYKSVQYSKVVALLVEALKEESAKRTKLEELVNQLKTENLQQEQNLKAINRLLEMKAEK